jgi:hypothetical protein
MVWRAEGRRLIDGCSFACIESPFSLAASARLGALGCDHSRRAHGALRRPLHFTLHALAESAGDRSRRDYWEHDRLLQWDPRRQAAFVGRREPSFGCGA